MIKTTHVKWWSFPSSASPIKSRVQRFNDESVTRLSLQDEIEGTIIVSGNIYLFLPKSHIESSVMYRDLISPQIHYGVESSVFLTPFRNIFWLESLYTLINPKEVERFLSTNKNVEAILFEIHEQIIRIFGEKLVEICLEHDQDPEEDFECLSIIIKTKLPPKESLILLDKFDNEWWLNVDDKIRIILNIMVRPI